MLLRHCIKHFTGNKMLKSVYFRTTILRNISTTELTKCNRQNKSKLDTNDLGDIGSKYQIFRDKDAPIILDIHEERLKYNELLNVEEKEADPFEGINLERGVSGVYDIEDLVQVLRRDNATDICVIAVSPDIPYVDYICIVTGNSQRHMKAMAQFVKKVYKRKRHDHDTIPLIEGKGSKDWLAIDLGNIALHIFSPQARKLYDLDSLWSVGADLDKECNKPEDPTNVLLEQHSVYLHDFQPAS